MNCFLRAAFVVCALGASLVVRAGDLPVISVELGATNVEHGLSLLQGGDGANEAVTAGGQSARRNANAGARSLYLYVRVTDPAYAPGPRDVYVTVEVFDDRVDFLRLEYDKAVPDVTLRSKYSSLRSPTLLAKSGTWRGATFHLPDLRMGRGQNGGADFRLVAEGVAVRRVVVSSTPPAGFSEDVVDAESLRMLKVERPRGMELTFGNDATPLDAALFSALGVSSIESYVDWAGVEPEEGKWDWSKWDKQVATLKAGKLKWVPFLIAGPAYATPLWFQQGPHSHVYRCLEHGRDSKVQSIFSPDLRPQIERFVRAFAKQYRDTGVIESLLLGVSGIYGESIYPAGPEGEWTAHLTGVYHNHHGWWAGDEFANAAFRKAMITKYGTIDSLNAAWGTKHPDFDAVKTFHPDSAAGDRARADFVEWYQEAMTAWATFWVKTVRDAFPDTEIYLCTGGNGDPSLGADFTAQARSIAPLRAGIRITNEGSSYDHNFTLTREVATATRLYGTFCGFEPASGVTPQGNVARIYNASASGARQLHCYNNNVVGNDERGAIDLFRERIGCLVPRTPRIDTAIYVPHETWAIRPQDEDIFFEFARKLRDITDHDFVTRQSIRDGVLKNHRTLFIAASRVLEPDIAATIEKWVQDDGGTLIVASQPGADIGSRLHDNTAWRQRMLAPATNCGPLFLPVCNNPPPRWLIAVGSNEDHDWIEGGWHGGEKTDGWHDGLPGTMRWTSTNAIILLPTQPGHDHTLHLSADIPDHALAKTPVTILINGTQIARIEKPGRYDQQIPVDTATAGTTTLARLQINTTPWKPTAHGHSNDTRTLGISVHRIEWHRRDAAQTPPATATLQRTPDTAAIARLTRHIGKGRTLNLPAILPDEETAIRAAATLLPDLPDARLDTRYATRTTDGLIWYNPADATITPTPTP